MATRRIWPDVAIPPGEFLAETLEERALSQTTLARQIRRPVQAINEIVRGKKAITPGTALQLEKALGVPAHVWTRLEADYQLTKARLAAQTARRTPTAALAPYAASPHWTGGAGVSKKLNAFAKKKKTAKKK
jgi:addiction module HigA family antidote